MVTFLVMNTLMASVLALAVFGFSDASVTDELRKVVVAGQGRDAVRVIHIVVVIIDAFFISTRSSAMYDFVWARVTSTFLDSEGD